MAVCNDVSGDPRPETQLPVISGNDLAKRSPSEADLRTAAGKRGGLRRPVPLPELHEALSSARIRAVYQPIVRLVDGAPVAIEALARLSHPVRGTVEPDLFVPQIEDAGLAPRLTESMGLVAFTEWAHGRLEALGMALALNFPLDVLLLPTALNWLDRTRAAAGIAATNVIIELTESRPIGKIADLASAVSRLRRAGYALAIDDVGPNLRDHRDLLELGFSSLKLDKQIVRRALQSKKAEDFVQRTTRAAHAAGMRVVAEGVARREHWDRMAALAVDEGQGFFFARPMVASSIAAWRSGWLSGRATATAR
jgi:EAL domain-containing protein (putative c-di-GMP-specific phosphodiesterase class I)